LIDPQAKDYEYIDFDGLYRALKVKLERGIDLESETGKQFKSLLETYRKLVQDQIDSAQSAISSTDLTQDEKDEAQNIKLKFEAQLVQINKLFDELDVRMEAQILQENK
jgi:hypothetical protein